ncbi:hypothetical protein [Sulfurimonas sp.]|uniref:hypothetical protein n=1 Tax=Sulfurimonas sp. TaxID=2022749 RepID=UPI0035679CB6
MPELICKLLHISKTTYYRYVKENYPIVVFLNSLEKEDLNELNDTGEIRKFELVKNLSYDELFIKLGTNTKKDDTLLEYIQYNFNFNKTSWNLKNNLDLFKDIYNEHKDSFNTNNAKEVLFEILNQKAISKFNIFASIDKPRAKKLITELTNSYSNAEVYVLVTININLKK